MIQKEQSKCYNNNDKEKRVALSKCSKRDRADENCIQAEIIPFLFCVCISILAYFYLNLSLLKAFFVLSMLLGLVTIRDGIKEKISLVVVTGVFMASLSLWFIFIYS